MIKLAASVLILGIVMIPQQTKGNSDQLSPQEIVNRVNNDPKSTWKADTYGMNDFDAQQFARSHLGARLDFHNDDGRRGAGARDGPMISPRWFQGMNNK